MIEFDETTHTYIVDGVVTPSVSEIMKPLSNHYYKEINDDILKMAADRGSAIHKATEFLDMDLDFEIKDTWKGYIEQYKLFKERYNPIFEGIEQQKTNGQYCGTVDRVCVIEGLKWLLDIKTSARINTKLVAVQLAGYKNLMIDEKIDKYGVIHLSKNKYELKEIEPNDEIWDALLKIYEYNEVGE